MLSRGTRVHESLGYDGQTGVESGRLIYIEYKIWVLNKIHPKPKRKTVGFPRVHDFRIHNPVFPGGLVEQVEQPLDGRRQRLVHGQDRHEEVVDKLLYGALGRQQAGQKYLRDRFVRPFAGLPARKLVVVYGLHQVVNPEIRAGLYVAVCRYYRGLHVVEVHAGNA